MQIAHGDVCSRIFVPLPHSKHTVGASTHIHCAKRVIGGACPFGDDEALRCLPPVNDAVNLNARACVCLCVGLANLYFSIVHAGTS